MCSKQTDGEVWNPHMMSKEQKYLLHHAHFASPEKMFKTLSKSMCRDSAKKMCIAPTGKGQNK